MLRSSKLINDKDEHFNVPNHGKLWKSLITAYLGDYQKTEKKLKKIATEEKINTQP